MSKIAGDYIKWRNEFYAECFGHGRDYLATGKFSIEDMMPSLLGTARAIGMPAADAKTFIRYALERGARFTRLPGAK